MTTKITDKNISELANAGVNWQSVFTGDGSTGLTAVAGRGYFIDTTSGTVTVTLPASPSAGDVVVLKDYARTWGTNNVTTASALIDGVTASSTFSTNGQTVTLVYMDGTKGWSLVNEDTTTNIGATFITATGGTVTTSGDFKIHTFTGDGSFVVSSLGNLPASQSTVDYMVIAGGGSGGDGCSGGGGGGAGGFRESKDSTLSSPHTASPLAATTGLTVTATTYPVTVGAGASGVTNPNVGTAGSNSVFSTITSAGGGGGGKWNSGGGSSGGSGGGSAAPCGTGNAGNTPPTSPPQGNAGGNLGYWQMAGGGGAGAAGTPGHATGGTGCESGSVRACKGCGGAGVTTSISGSSIAYAGGGGGGNSSWCAVDNFAQGGTGGGGAGGGPSPTTGGTSGTSNTGGGGGGNPGKPGNTSGAGGKGIVIIRYKYQ